MRVMHPHKGTIHKATPIISLIRCTRVLSRQAVGGSHGIFSTGDKKRVYSLGTKHTDEDVINSY